MQPFRDSPRDDTIIAMDTKLLRTCLPLSVRSLQRASRREGRGANGGSESPIATRDSVQSQKN